MAAIRESSSGRRSLLRLGGVDCGFVAAMGGAAYGEVVEQLLGAGNIVGKHIGAPRYEDIVLVCTEPPDTTLTDWIKVALAGQATPHDGEIVELDFDGKERSRLSFWNATIREVTFPALDVASRSPAQLGLRLAPERTSRGAGSGSGAKTAALRGKQKLWQSDSFRLTIDGLDCKKVTRIDPLVVRQSFTASATEQIRDPALLPGRLEIPDLVVTLSAAAAAGWFAWQEDLVVLGSGTEKNGVLEFLAPGSQTTIATLTLSGLGIYRLADDTFAATSQAIARVQATMYCERLAFNVDSPMDSPSTAGPPTALAAPPTAAAPPSRADVIAPLGDAPSPRLTARRELLGQLRPR